MKSYENYLAQKGYRATTIGRQLKEVVRFGKWLKSQNKTFIEVNYPNVLSYLSHRQSQGISESTVQNYLNALQNYYAYLVEKNQIKISPIQYLKLRKRGEKIRSNNLLIDVLSKQELEQSYQIYVSNKRLLLRNKVLLGLHIFQGIQSGEESHLQVQDIDFAAATIYIKGSGRLKARKVNLAAQQIFLLQSFLSDKSSKNYLFQYHSETYATNVRTHLIQQINLELNRKDKQWKVDNLVHIRRSVIVNWLKEQSLRQVQYWAGHRWVSSTERYLRADIAELQQAIDIYHPLHDSK